MTIRRQIQEIPGALRKTLEIARTEYGAVARKIRWGDGPVLICGEGECADLAGTACSTLNHFPPGPWWRTRRRFF